MSSSCKQPQRHFVALFALIVASRIFSVHCDGTMERTSRTLVADDFYTDLSETFYSNLPPSKQLQIDNYRNGEALMVNIHITHHAGTHLCGVMGRNVEPPGPKGSPAFACMGDRTNVMDGAFPKNYPWPHDDVAKNIQLVRPYFHFISWEFGYRPHKNTLENVDWEDPNLVTVIVVKNPIDRLLTFFKEGRCSQELGYEELYKETHRNGNYSYLSHDDWWKCAKGELPVPRVMPRANDNYGLRILAGEGCCQGANTDRKYLD